MFGLVLVWSIDDGSNPIRYDGYLMACQNVNYCVGLEKEKGGLFRQMLLFEEGLGFGGKGEREDRVQKGED